MPAVTISPISIRRARPCSLSRAVNSSTAATVDADRHPRRLGQRDRPEEISQDVADRHHQPDIRAAFGVDLVDVPPVVAGQPGAEHEEADAERQQMLGIEPVEQPTRQRQQRKGAHPAGPRLPRLGMELLEGEAEEKPEAQQQQEAGDR